MRLLRSFLIIILIYISLCHCIDQPKGPPTLTTSTNTENEKTNSDNEITDPEDEDNKKENEILDSDENLDFLKDSNVEDYAKKQVYFEKLIQQTIEIIKPSEFTQEKESKKSFLTELLDDHEKYIQKLTNEIEEINSQTKNEKEEPVELTAEEIEAQNLYEKGMEILNKTRIDKSHGYALMHQAAQKGHAKARAEIAWAQLMGNPLPFNIQEARDTFLELAKIGLPEAHMGLGFMYATGIGFNVSQPKAILHYTFGALGDNTWAQMALGYRQWAGITLPNSCEKALSFYKRVAEKVASQVTFSGGTAVHRIRLLDEVENSGLSSGILDNDLIEYYQLLADKGDIQAQVGLGQLHYQGGRGIPLDHEKALQYFTKAANSGNAVAMAFLGKIYLEGRENVKQDNDTAFKYFKKAADLNNPVGQSGLGIMYLQGKGVPKDTAKALNYFTLAADQGWVDGQLQLGNMYFSGIGVQRDFKMAYKFFHMASQSGHVLAFYHLGQMHALGLGIVRSCSTAVELFKNVAEREKRSERLMLAHLDYKNYRYKEAFMQYALMAELGYEVAQSNAAFILDHASNYHISGDIEMLKNEKLVRALQYWGRAAAQGYSSAQVKLGDYHYYGLGTSVDYEIAASHYRTASEQQHNAQAMFNLGYMHEQGLGMEKDWHLAKRFYDLAAETSADAKVPVALALLKLQLLLKLESLKNSPFNILLELDENISSNWDLYLITILTILVGFIFYIRRPPQDPIQQQEDNRPEPNQEPQL